MKTSNSPTFSKKEAKKDEMDFPTMLKEILLYKRITKLEWGNKDIYYIELKDGTLVLHKEDGYHSWIISEADLIGKDWVIVK